MRVKMIKVKIEYIVCSSNKTKVCRNTQSCVCGSQTIVSSVSVSVCDHSSTPEILNQLFKHQRQPLFFFLFFFNLG